MHARGLRPTGACPYCAFGVPEDQDQLLWWCDAWATAGEPFIADVMLLAEGIRLGSSRDWPPCLRLCAGIVPESVVKTSGMDQDSRWRKRCKELYHILRS